MRALRLLLALVFTPFATVAALTARTAFSNPALRATPSWILRDSVEGFSAVEAIALLAVGMIARAVGGMVVDDDDIEVKCRFLGKCAFQRIRNCLPAV